MSACRSLLRSRWNDGPNWRGSWDGGEWPLEGDSVREQHGEGGGGYGEEPEEDADPRDA
jgi:hypothetical protein